MPRTRRQRTMPRWSRCGIAGVSATNYHRSACPPGSGGAGPLAALQDAEPNATECIRILKLRIDADRLRQAQAVTRPTVRASLYDFARETWPLVASGRELIDTWHVRALCAHLEALADGRIRRLLISLPPRLAKSTLCSVVYPAWVWSWKPETRFLTASYSAKLSEGFSASTRGLLKSDWWSARYDTRLSSDVDTKARYKNTAGGERIATSVGGSTLGLGGDTLVADDIHHPSEVISDTERDKAIAWFRSAWTTRADNPNEARHLVIGQRLHQRDLPGELIASGEWCVLSLANERPAEPCRTSLPWTDPRPEEGDLLCPALLGAEETAQRRRTLGTDYNAQYAQEPVPPGGALFERESITILDAIPDDWRLQTRLRFWDPAANRPKRGYSDPDWSVGALVARYQRPDDTPVWCVEHIRRLRGEPATVDAAIKATAESDGPEVRICEERQPGASGKTVIDLRRKGLEGYIYTGRRLSGDKAVRFQPVSVQVKAGNIVVLRGDWNETLIRELIALPGGKHDDQCDAVSGGFVCTASAPIEQVDGGVF